MRDHPRYTWEIYGFFVPTYRKVGPAPIAVIRPDEVAAARAAGRLRTAVYVTKNLLSVVALGDVLALPDMVRVVFASDESPAPPREAYRLTPELYETVRDKTFAMIDAARSSRGAADGDGADDLERAVVLQSAAAAEDRLAALHRLGLEHGAVIPGQ